LLINLKYYQEALRQSSEKANSTGEESKRLKGELEKAEELSPPVCY